jgi:hypothetical protein
MNGACKVGAVFISCCLDKNSRPQKNFQKDVTNYAESPLSGMKTVRVKTLQPKETFP